MDIQSLLENTCGELRFRESNDFYLISYRKVLLTKDNLEKKH
jgi:hypothetical protein